jgi:hypothetical protein
MQILLGDRYDCGFSRASRFLAIQAMAMDTPESRVRI